MDNALAVRKIKLVYGGGIQGLWGSVIISAIIKMSKLLVVIMKELDNKIFCTGNELRVLSLPKQMGSMLYNVDTFITLPIGLKTLEEISIIAYWAKLNFH